MSLFGAPVINGPDGTPIPLTNRRARALLAMTCLFPREALERDHVARLLWPGRFPAQARASLRQCLLALDKACAPHCASPIKATRDTVGVDPDIASSDLSELEHALANRWLDKAASMIEDSGPRLLLDQMHFGDGYQQWLAATRQQVHNRLQVAVNRALSAAREEGDPAGHDRLIEAWQASGRASLVRTEPPDRSLAKDGRDPEAQALYLQGRSLSFRAIGDGVLEKAVELLEAALAIEPDFAECWTALAEAHVNTAVYTPCLERVERSHKMAECARRAIAIDPAQGHAHAMLGIHEWTLENPVGALDFAFEAYRLEPDNADVLLRLGSFLLYIGRPSEALPYIEAAIAKDPVFGRNYAMLSAAHFSLGNIDEALAAGERMVDLGMPGMWLAMPLVAKGENEAAFAAYYKSRLLMNIAIVPPAGMGPMTDEARDAYWMVAAKGCCSGDPEDSRRYCQLLDGLHASMADPYDPSIILPAIWMGHADLVMKIYRERIHPANMFGLMSLWADFEPTRQIRQ
ncbi:MAG: hypothetical protein AAGE86_11920, partial [Pseudomonadota bacterium]